MGITAVRIAMTEAYLEACHSLYLASQAVAQSVGTGNIVRKMRDECRYEMQTVG